MTSGREEQASGAGRAITAIVRAVVERAVPEELPVVDGLGVAGDREIIARLSRRTHADERLGFGLDDVAVLVTPVLYIVLDQSLRTVVDSSLGGAGRRLHRLRRRRRSTDAVPALSPHQIAEIRDQVADLARQRGVPPATVDRVGAAVVAVLSDVPGLSDVGALSDVAGPSDRTAARTADEAEDHTEGSSDAGPPTTDDDPTGGAATPRPS